MNRNLDGDHNLTNTVEHVNISLSSVHTVLKKTGYRNYYEVSCARSYCAHAAVARASSITLYCSGPLVARDKIPI